MWSSEREVDVMQLKRGMFVVRLDRPWEGTCFPVQGFLIKSDEDISNLCLYCERVYIDAYKSHAPDSPILQQQIVKPKTEKTKKKNKADEISSRAVRQLLSRLAIEHYRTTSTFKREVQRAVPILKQLEAELNHLLTPKGYVNKSVYQHVHNSASDLAESVIRNPDAMVWLCRVKHNNSQVYQHVLRLAILGCLVGRQMGLNRFILVDLTVALLMTGIGKSLIKPSVLHRYRCDDVPIEYRQHLKLTLDRIADSKLPGTNLMDTIANYCERIDGSGYPAGKKGKTIPLLARIAGLIEYFELQTNPFDTSVARSPSEAISQLNFIKGTLFDDALVEKFVTAIGIYPTGTLVELNDDRIGIVCSQTYEKRLRASIIPLTNRRGDRVESFQILDLNLPNQWQLSDTKLRIRRGVPINCLGDNLVEAAHEWLFRQNIGTWGKVRSALAGL